MYTASTTILYYTGNRIHTFISYIVILYFMDTLYTYIASKNINKYAHNNKQHLNDDLRF